MGALSKGRADCNAGELQGCRMLSPPRSLGWDPDVAGAEPCWVTASWPAGLSDLVTSCRCKQKGCQTRAAVAVTLCR